MLKENRGVSGHPRQVRLSGGPGGRPGMLTVASHATEELSLPCGRSHWVNNGAGF